MENQVQPLNMTFDRDVAEDFTGHYLIFLVLCHLCNEYLLYLKLTSYPKCSQGSNKKIDLWEPCTREAEGGIMYGFTT